MKKKTSLVRAKESANRTIGYVGTVSGGTSIISSYSVCHQLCMAIIAVLSIIGISVSGMPLLFLQQYNTLFWSIGVTLLIIGVYIYYQKGCISGKLLLTNTGLLVAGIPFKPLVSYQLLLWMLGGALVLSSIILWTYEKKNNKKSQPGQSPRVFFNLK
ncbi:MAG: hypothetical protein AABX52_01085 [Nanoarchaeota archaeon]